MKDTALNINKLLMAAIAAVVVVLFPHCTADISGGGSEAGNARIFGMVTDSQGAPVANVIVQIMPSDFDPIKDEPIADSCIDTTAADGVYRFGVTQGGMYTIQAVHTISRSRALVAFVKANTTDDTVPKCTLQQPGAVRVMFPAGSDIERGYFYIPGTTFHAFLNDTSGDALLDSVPAGIVPSVSYSSINKNDPVVIRQNVHVLPGDTVTVVFQDRLFSKRLILNTSASGANVQGNVYGFPVLIRLDAGNFDFSHTAPDGSDIMFTGSGNKSLPVEIERWDATANRAEIWVKVDTVFGNDSVQSITMYWGNAAEAELSSGTAVFDTATGFAGVWHLGDGVDGPVRDATVNRFDGVSPDTAKPQIAEGVIGNCRVFDGVTDYITMPNTADGKLNFPQGSNYTVSAWVCLDTFDNASHLIVSKGYEQYYLRFTYVPSDSPLWEFVEFSETANWQASTFPATSRQWAFLTGVRQGSGQFLYYNGVLVDSTMEDYPNGMQRNTLNDLSIGKFLKAVTDPTNEGYCFFKGSIDEVRIMSAAQNQDWVRLCYMNQRTDDRLIMYK